MRTNAEVSEATHRRIRIAELKLQISRSVEHARMANRELVKMLQMDRRFPGRPGRNQNHSAMRATREQSMGWARNLQQLINELRGTHKMSDKNFTPVAGECGTVPTTGEDQPFTVITSQGLDHGLDTYFAHVMAPDADEAVIFGVAEACNDQECDADEIDVLGVFAGHHSPVRWADGGVEYDLSRFTKRLVTILPKV